MSPYDTWYNWRYLAAVVALTAGTGLTIVAARDMNYSYGAIVLIWIAGLWIGGLIGSNRKKQVTLHALGFGLLALFFAVGFWMTVFARLLFGPKL